jgi:DNA-binding NtrC family response regulator
MDARRALLLDPDLFFVTKITATLRSAGYETRTARDVTAFAGLLAELAPVVALVNLAGRGIDWHAAVQAARAAHVPIIAYGPHVDVALHAAARAAGATRVIANAKLATDLPEIVARTVRLDTAVGDSTIRDAAPTAARPQADSRDTGSAPFGHTPRPPERGTTGDAEQ